MENASDATASLTANSYSSFQAEQTPTTVRPQGLGRRFWLVCSALALVAFAVLHWNGNQYGQHEGSENIAVSGRFQAAGNVSPQPTFGEPPNTSGTAASLENFACGGDRTAVARSAPQVFKQSKTWKQEKSEIIRVKLWGGGGMGGTAARLMPTDGFCAGLRRLRGGRGGGYTGLGTKADLDNHANQMNPNNWRYWSSRGMQPPWQAAGNAPSSESSSRDLPGAMFAPYSVRYQKSSSYTGTGTKADLDNHANQLNPNNWRYWRSRGLPVAIARQYARQAALAAKKWIKSSSRWRVAGSDDSSRRLGAPCGEVWLCGGGGSSGAFTDAMVELKAGQQYRLEVGVGGSIGAPDGSPSRLVKVTAAGPVVLAEAPGGFGAGGVDENRLVALGGTGAAASDVSSLESNVQQALPGGDGAPSRSDFRDLFDANLLLATTDIPAVRNMTGKEMQASLSAIRIPCAAAARDGSSYEQFLSTVTATWPATSSSGSTRLRFLETGLAYLGTSIRYPPTKHEDTVADHMLVCLPPDSGAYGSDQIYGPMRRGYGFDQTWNGDRVRIKSGCTCRGPYAPIPEGTEGNINDFQGDDYLVVFDNQPLNPRGVVKCSSRCLERASDPFNGSQCLGVACVRTRPDGECKALPSCLNGFAAWIGRAELGNTATDNDYQHNKQFMDLPLSSWGPQGGVALEGAPAGEPAGHGGDGACPELTPRPPPTPVLLQTVLLEGFRETGEFSKNGVYTERRSDDFLIGGKHTWWSESGSYFLFWCAASDVSGHTGKRWMLASVEYFWKNQNLECLGTAKAPSDQELQTVKFYGWLEYARGAYGHQDWVETKAGIASFGNTLSSGSIRHDELARAMPQAGKPNPGEAGLAMFYSCAAS